VIWRWLSSGMWCLVFLYIFTDFSEESARSTLMMEAAVPSEVSQDYSTSRARWRWTVAIHTNFVFFNNILTASRNTNTGWKANKETFQPVAYRMATSDRYSHSCEPSTALGEHTVMGMMMDFISDMPVVSLSRLCYFLLSSTPSKTAN